MAAVIDSAAEVWRAIPGHDGYEASSLGRVRSIDRTLADGRRCKGRILRCWSAGSRREYRYVGLGQFTKVGVHRLVALAFHGEHDPDRPEAAHLNGDASDNRSCNIVWVSRSENEQHKRAHGTYQRPVNYYKPGQKRRGPKRSKHPRAAAIARRRAEGATLDQLASEFGMSKSGMHGVIKWRL